MEKIVTKIGDVTIQRRAKPQQQPQPAVGQQVPPQQQYQHFQQPQQPPSHQQFPVDPGNLPHQQHVAPFKNFPPNQGQIRQNLPLNKNVPRPVSKNVNFGGVPQQGGSSDLMPGVNPKKQMHPSAAGPSQIPRQVLPQQRISDSLKNQESLQKLDSRFQLDDKVSKIGVNKNPRPDLINKDSGFSNKIAKPPVRNQQIPLKVEQTKKKDLKSEPDISKYSGISIERRKKIEPQPQELPKNPLMIPGVNVQRVPANKENPIQNLNLSNEYDEDYSDYEEDFEEGQSDEDFDEANFPDPSYGFGQNPVPVEKKQMKLSVQYPLENTRQMPKPQPQPQPQFSVKNAQPTQPVPQPHKNIPILEKFKQSGLTIEKRKPPEVKKPIDFNIPGIDIQRLGKAQNQHNVKQAPEKSLQEDNAEDDDKQFEGYESDLKEGEDYDEYYENESEEFEEQAVKGDTGKMPNLQTMPNIPNIPGVSFEKRKRPDINLEELAKQSGISIERRKDPQENLAKKPKPAFQNKSPIVLSSEDDEKIEEESPEEESEPVQQQVQKKPEPNLPPGISIQKRKLPESPEKKSPAEMKFQKNAEELRFMNEDDEQIDDYPVEDEDDFDDDLDPNLQEEYDPSQYDPNFQKQAPALKPPDKPKIPGISNADLERFVQRSGITIEKKNQPNQSKESEDFENYEENPEQFDDEEGYDDMEGEGEYDEMEDEAYYNEEENPDAFANPTEDLQMPEEDMGKVPEMEEGETEENLEEKDKLDESKDEEKETDINDMVCKDLVELIQKGEIEGEIEDDKDEEDVKKDDIKRKAEETEGESNAEEEEVRKSKRKKKKKNETDEDAEEDEEEEEDDEEDEEEGKETDKNIDKSKITSTALRKNIREVMDETKLDESTIAAQRQEAERLKRLQEQQRIIREVQKQIQMSKQNEKSQNKVLSLLQGNTQTSILKTSSAATPTSSTQVKVPNHVLVKLSNGQQTSLSNKKMMELLKTSTKTPSGTSPPNAKTLLKQGMVTPSVSIAPLIKKEPKEQQPQQQQTVQPPQQPQSEQIDEKKKKKGDIVTLSSDSEDDCIVLSDEEESEPEEDPTNSGMHTSDKYNVPDEQGRVVVNVGHPETEEDLYLAPQIARIIKPHQIGGIRFLYDNVIESIERFTTSSGFGCILAHSMGLGKTLQIVSFSDIFLRYTSARTILVIMPINTIQNWLAEFNMWLPKENKTDADIRCREFDLFIVNESLKNINSRSKVILEWHKNGGVLLMGYELFRLLSLKKSHKSKKKRKSERDEKELDSKHKELIEEVYAALVRPGPDLVICDEGHRIKNSHATTSQALKQIRTKRRIVLTGYPLQNNLLEYWCMVDFVRPNYLGSKTEFSNMFERPIQNGQCIDSTPQDKRLMRYRAHVLHSLLEGFVQRRSHAVLQNALPEKEEYVLLLRFTPFQRKLYDTFMNEVVRTVAVPNPLKAFAVCCKIWNHPDVLYNFLKKKGEEIDLDLEEALPPSMQPPGFPYGQHQQENPATQFNQVPPAPQPWPKRGPGSRGGKIRHIGRPRVGRGGRKPAASIPPNLNTNLPPPEKPTSENENFNAGMIPSAGTNFNQTSSEHGLDANRNPGGEFPGRNYNQNQFGSSSYNDYSNQSSYQSNTNFNSKNPLDNLEDISSGNFQNKRFFDSSSNNSGNHSNFPTPTQNFESSQNEQNFSQTINSPNDSNMNASFESNLNSSDSTYNQNDSTKSFDYNPEYNQEFFPGENFQNSQQAANFPTESKQGFTRDDGNSNSNSYFQGANTNNANFDYQSTGSGMGTNFQSFNRPSGGNFQNSNSTTASSSNVPSSSSNFQGNVQNSNFQPPPSNTGSEFIQTDFQGPSGNFPCSNQNNQSGNFQNSGTDANYQGTESNYMDRGFNQQQQQGYWSGSTWVPCSSATGDGSFVPPPKYGAYEGGEIKAETKMMSGGSAYCKSGDLSGNFKTDSNSSYPGLDEKKTNIKLKDEEDKKEEFKIGDTLIKKEDSLPYDWATDLFKNYVTGVIENSSKMEVFFHIVNESIKLGDRLLVFSQSLLTLDLIEDYLQRRNVPDKDFKWAKHRNYFRLDGSTPGLEREKLINEFNSNNNVYLFLVSTRAGSLGINLVGANRVVVFDASWNPCHDTQAVCRVYRYGQQKPCFVYRLVMDNCLEKKIYDRQINKQGMADRVVDELNPDAHLSIKEVTNLCWDDQEDTTVKDFSHLKDKYNDEIVKTLLNRCSKLLSKEPFQHESLLIDRKEKKLSQAEKRLAKRSYELEKQAANQPKNIYSFFPNATGPRNFGKPIASVRPMQSEMGTNRGAPSLPSNRSRWIPAEVWQKQGMSAQEMTLPLDVVIPTNSPDKTSIVLKAGQRVMVLKSPKGIYMQLENGKIIAIRTAFKVGQNGPPTAPPPPSTQPKPEEVKKDIPIPIASTLKNNPNVTISPKTSNPSAVRLGTNPTKQPFLKPFTKGPEKKIPVNLATARSRQIATGKAKPFTLNRKFQSVTPEIKQRLMAGKMGYEPPSGDDKLSLGEQSGAEDGMLLDDKTDDDSFIDDGMNESPDEKPDDKLDSSDSLETLRKVTERISVDPKPRGEDNDGDPKNVQMSSLKKYRHNFTSHIKNKSQGSDEGKKDVSESETEGEDVKGDEENSSTQQGNENVQNWLMNQSYPPMDPYGNYFPGYYGYGPGPAPPMMPPYDGFYPGNYGHPMGRNSPMVPPPVKQESSDHSKTAPQQPQQPIPNPNVQNVQNVAAPRNSPVLGTPPMYPPYPNPYPYPYNYPANPGFNNQGYPYPPQTTAVAPTTSTTTNASSTNQPLPPTQQQQPGQQQMQQPPYDNSMYSAFHRPDGHFQGPENPFPPPYPRPPYPNSGTPGFFPYNAPYPNYPYGNFNPYMHPPGYGYPMQNPPPVNNPNNSNVNSNQSSAGVDGNSSSTNNNNNANNS